MSLVLASISSVLIFAGLLCLPLAFFIHQHATSLPVAQRKDFYHRWSNYFPTYADGGALIAVGFAILLLQLLGRD